MRRRWKILCVVAAVLVALVCLWIGTLGIAPEKGLAAYKQSLLAQGEKLEISQVEPPPVPPGQNGVDVFNQAVGRLTYPPDHDPQFVPAMRMIGPGKAIVCFQQPDVRADDFTNSWEVEMAGVEANRDATEQFRQLINFPALDFNINYEGVTAMQVEFLASFYQCEAALSAEAICDLHAGDTGATATNICALLAVACGQHDARLEVCQESRMELMSIATGPSWELLQATNLDDGELAMLQKSWEQLELIHAVENAVVMERAVAESLMGKMRADKSSVGPWGPVPRTGVSTFKDYLNDAKYAYARAMWKASWGYSDELLMLQNDQAVLETTRTIETNGFFDPAFINMANGMEAERTNVSPNWLEKAGIPDLRKDFSLQAGALVQLLDATMTAETERQIVITAIALKRYQLKHGAYPENLNSLVPDFVSAVPRDPVDGKPLRYRQNSDGTFLLYSVGENGKDDGGTASSAVYSDYDWLGPDAPDWVWPQPATAEEIQAFYALPPK